MSASIRDLLTSAVDFLPSHLSISEGFKQYQSELKSSTGWMLDRFVVSADDLPGLTPVLKRTSPEICVVGSMAAEQASWEAARSQEAALMTKFQQEAEDLAEIVAYELPLPKGNAIDQTLKSLKGFTSVEVFLRVNVDDDLEDNLGAIAEQEDFYVSVDAGATDAQGLAQFIHTCLSLDLVFSVTAGVSNPYSDGQSAGFLNVMGGAALADAHDLTPNELVAILKEKDSSVLNFDGPTIRWKTLTVGHSSIEDSRASIRGFRASSAVALMTNLQKLGFWRNQK